MLVFHSWLLCVSVLKTACFILPCLQRSHVHRQSGNGSAPYDELTACLRMCGVSTKEAQAIQSGTGDLPVKSYVPDSGTSTLKHKNSPSMNSTMAGATLDTVTALLCLIRDGGTKVLPGVFAHHVHHSACLLVAFLMCSQYEFNLSSKAEVRTELSAGSLKIQSAQQQCGALHGSQALASTGRLYSTHLPPVDSPDGDGDMLTVSPASVMCSRPLPPTTVQHSASSEALPKASSSAGAVLTCGAFL